MRSLRTYSLMRKYFFFALLVPLVVACSTSKISIRKEELKKIKTVAVMPFTSTVVDTKVTREATEVFRASLVEAGFAVVEREKLEKILKEKELAQTGLIENKALETSQFLGAQATLLGEVTGYSLKVEDYMRTVTEPGAYPVNPKTGQADTTQPRLSTTKQVPDKRKTFEFQVMVRLVSNVDGTTIFTVQNEYPVQTYTADTPGIHPSSLDEFRAAILARMATDLEKALKDARE